MPSLWNFLGSMLPKYIALCFSQLVCQTNSLGYIVGASPPLCVRSIDNTVGASPPHVCPLIGSLHAAYSALRHFYIITYKDSNSFQNLYPFSLF